MRHGLRTKCVDACRTSRALVGDYSPKDVAFGQRLAGAEMALDQRRVTQKGIGHDTHLATRLQMLGGALDQRFAGLVAGVHALVEGWVADDGGQLPRRSVDAIAGNDFSFEPVGGQRPATALDGEGVDVQQHQLALRITALQRGTENAGTAAEIQQSATGQIIEVLEQQGAAQIQPTMAEHTRQADHLERPVSQLQGEMAGQGIEIWRGGRLLDLDLPELAVAGTVKLARTAEAAQLLGGALDAAALLAHQV